MTPNDILPWIPGTVLAVGAFLQVLSFQRQRAKERAEREEAEKRAEVDDEISVSGAWRDVVRQLRQDLDECRSDSRALRAELDELRRQHETNALEIAMSKARIRQLEGVIERRGLTKDGDTPVPGELRKVE